MTEKQFNKEIQDLLDYHRRRIHKLARVLSGDAKLKRYHVKSYKVKSYVVKSHYRYV